MSETVLEIDCASIRNNLETYRSLLKPGTQIITIVKAFSYGLGLIAVSKFLQKEGVDCLGVTYLSEALELRREGVNVPIIVLNPEGTDFTLYRENDLLAAIYSLPLLKRFIESRSRVGIHLKLETGMNRLGFSGDDLQELCNLLLENPWLKVEGIFTHFSSSDNLVEDEFTRIQAKKFEEMCDATIKVLKNKPTLHAVNSAGTVRFPEFHFDMVRLGIGLMGFDPTHTLNLRHVSTLKTIVTQIKNIKKGESISYARSGQADSDMTIAILPIGYADGYLRTFGNGHGSVSIGGQLVPTIGNICMNMTIIDISHVDAKEGQEVTLFGKFPTIEKLATVANTIPYEILTNVREHVSRVYINQ